MKFNYTERFVCPYCKKTWVFRAESLTMLVAKVKQASNMEIQEHYVECSVDYAIANSVSFNEAFEKSFDEKFCEFLKSIGINAKLGGIYE